MARNAPASTQESEAPASAGSPTLFSRRLSPRHVSTFCRQLAVLLDAGIPMVRALKILGRRTSGGGMQSLVSRVTADVEAGGAFSTALQTHGPGLPSIVVPLCRAGEKAGELSTNLRYLADNLDHDEQVKDKVTEAMIFPVITFVFTVGVLLFILMVVAPMFKTIIDDAPGKIDLPWFSQLVFNLSHALQSPIVKGLVLLGAGLLVFALWRGASMRNYIIDFLKLRIPYIGRMITVAAMARFGKTLAALLRTGVPVLESLRLARGTVDNMAIEEAVVDMEKSVENGGRMSAPLEQHWFIPELARDMIVIGEESGSMAEMLDNLSEVFRTEVDRMQGRIVSLIQPVLTILLGILVLFVLLSMFLPYFSILMQGTAM
jgi:type IV pilus assembly protein PilC